MSNDVSDVVFNRDAFLANFEGMEELVTQVIESFEENYPSLLARVKNAIDSSDMGELQISAHTLKGVVSNFYAEHCRLLAFELEKMGKEKEATRALNVFDKLSKEAGRLSVALRSVKL
ncbi:MAG: Hpt domain-containing protein [Verrucomicrobiota bacterium]